MAELGQEEEEDWDELISRFLDGDVDPATLAELERNPRFAAALRRAVRIQQELKGLPQSTPDPGPPLTARIMRSLPSAPDGVKRRSAWGWLWRPLPLPAWSVALALLLLAVGGGYLLRPAPRPGPAPHTPTAAPMPAHDACPTRVMVRFVLKAPEARQVQLVGDFNAWSVEATPLGDDGNGTWTVLVPLEPGRYQYKFVVDGNWTVDPDAPAYLPDGFGGKNALLAI
jgi:hypothetical protein